MHARGHEAGDVGHVHEEFCAHLVGDFAEALEVDDARVGGSAGHDDLRMAFHGLLLHLIVIDAAGFLRDAVGLHMEETAGEVDRAAVGEMTAVGEIHAEQGVAGLHDGEIGGHVGLRAGMGLHVGVAASEELLRAVDGQILGDVHVFAAAVVARVPDSLQRTCGSGSFPEPGARRGKRSFRRR